MTALPTAEDLPQRVQELDGVRGIAIVAVVAMHAAFYARADARLAGEPIAQAMLLGWSGVDLFFVLSGFLITGILVRSRGGPRYFTNFYARRALRIFPLYYAVLALLLYGLDRPPATPSEQASYLLYYQNWRWLWGFDVQRDLAREITWSLAIEEQFYLVWPALVLLAPRRVLPWLCGAIALAAIGLRALLVERVDVVYHLTPCRLDALAVGACLAVVPRPPMWFGRAALLGGVAGLGASAVRTGSPLPTDNPGMQLWGLVAALAAAAGLVTLARGGGLVARVCRCGPLRSFGRFSYCIYLAHILVVEWLAARFVDLASASPEARVFWTERCPALAVLFGFTAASLALVWCLGWASWHLFEKHFLALKRHFAAGTANGEAGGR